MRFHARDSGNKAAASCCRETARPNSIRACASTDLEGTVYSTTITASPAAAAAICIAGRWNVLQHQQINPNFHRDTVHGTQVGRSRVDAGRGRCRSRKGQHIRTYAFVAIAGTLCDIATIPKETNTAFPARWER
jgi:hypothetical protein